MLFSRFICTACAFSFGATHFVEGKEPTVAVIGAGLAGLTTAYRLHEQGIETQVYEARNRVGGRVFSVKIGDKVGELGGQNISDGKEAENMMRLIEECELEVQWETYKLNQQFFTGDRFIPARHLTEGKFDPIELKKELAEAAKDAHSMRDIMEKVIGVEDEFLFRLVSTNLAGYEGAVIEKLSPLYIDTLYHRLIGGLSAAYGKAPEEMKIETCSIKGGNSLLPDALAKKLGERVHLDSPLEKVAKTENGSFELYFRGGKTAFADILVLAIPCTVYEDILFEEGVLPKERLERIQNVQYGTNAKILIPFLTPLQEKTTFINDRIGAFFTNPEIMTLYFTKEFGHFTESSIEEAYAREYPMLEKGLKEKCPAFVTPHFAHDEFLTSYEGPVGFSWPNDPYAKGSYSYIASGQESLLTQTHVAWGEVVKTLFSPIDDRLFFAGEHTSILEEIPGTMEAASESGERTARMILSKIISGANRL